MDDLFGLIINLKENQCTAFNPTECATTNINEYTHTHRTDRVEYNGENGK